METNELRNLYDSLLDSGDLFIVLSGAKGIWEEDRARFIRLQNSFEKVLKKK